MMKQQTEQTQVQLELELEQLPKCQQQQQQQQQLYHNMDATTQRIAAEQTKLKLPTIEATIIDIPSTNATEATTTTTTTARTMAATTINAATVSTSISSSSASSASSSYDTDCSTASSTCCTRQGEHIYMQRAVICDMPQTATTSTTTTTGAVAIATATHKNAQQHDDEDEGIYKAELEKHWPWFILAISVIEIGIFVYDRYTMTPQNFELVVPIPTDSVLVYRPDRRLQVWRFFSYMFLHANWFHLGFNVIIQLFFGVPLEVMHGTTRIGIVYLAGVFAGSLGTSVVDSNVYLVGASGGVYALLAAHLANVTLNYAHMKSASTQLGSVIIFVTCDLGYAVYVQYIDTDVPAYAKGPQVSYIAHLTGALAGVTIGFLVLKNFGHRAYENLIWWLALGVYCAFTVFAIVFNLLNTVTAQLMEEQGEVITQHLLHDLGVS